MSVASLLRVALVIGLSATEDGGGRLLDLIPPEFQIIFPLIFLLVALLVLTGVLYLAGLVVVGGKRARFRDAFIISFLGTVLSTVFVMLIPYPFISLILSVFVWLLLIKRLYETRWLGAIAVGLLAMIIFVAIAIILGFIFGIIEDIRRLLFSTFTFVL